jgi:hypothetical protein
MATLRQISASLLISARAAEGRPFRRSLPRGLVIEVVQLESGDVQLTLERRDVAPADQEWATTLKHWPECVPDGVVPQARTEGRRHALIARWPRPVEMGETAL